MPTHSEIKHLPYSAEQMYSLVADIENYSEFLPWCSAARIRDRLEEDDHEVIIADLVISFKVFREKFGSRVVLWPETLTIDTAYLDGPFKHMVSNWSFKNIDEGSEVTFFVDFEFKNALLQKMIGMFFNEAMQRVVRAFEKRANYLYR